MSKTVIRADRLQLTYPIYSIRAQSLRNSVVNLAVGGKLLKNEQDVIHVQALDNVSFTVEEGDRLGVIGHNGSGKTTLLKVLTGVYEPTNGDLFVDGKVSSMIDPGHGLNFDATGLENVTVMGHLRGLTTKEIRARLPEITEFSGLGAYINLPMKTYSAGMSMRLVLAVATCFDPDILVLDEWLGAGDASFVDKATQRMRDFVDKSRAIVIATHSTELVKSFCNKVLHLEGGRVRYFGDIQGCQALMWPAKSA